MSTPNEEIEKQTILVVDDTPDNLALMSALLRDLYKVKVANSGERALSIAASSTPIDLILLDVMMPGMDGYEVLRQLRTNPQTRDIPVIFLTSKREVKDERLGLELGAVDYITKPISPPIVLARVKSHLELSRMRCFLQSKNEFLEHEVENRTREIRAIQDVSILALASLAETRDNDTGAHIRRTQLYVRVLSQHLQNHPRFAWFLTEANIELLYKSAPLHDIGKVGIPDVVLLKPGRLSDEEREIMNTHTTLGCKSIELAEARLGTKVKFLTMAEEIALSHHEKWDGTGYPQGLVGDNIPITARIMALADVYDALISKRVYKPPFSLEEARSILIQGREIHFDPDILEAFTAKENAFHAIAKEHADTNTD